MRIMHCHPYITQHLKDPISSCYTEPCYKEDSVIMKNSCKPDTITVKHEETNPAINEIYIVASGAGWAQW